MQTFWKTVWPHLLKLKTHTHFDLVISLLTTYPTEIKEKKNQKLMYKKNVKFWQKQGTSKTMVHSWQNCKLIPPPEYLFVPVFMPTGNVYVCSLEEVQRNVDHSTVHTGSYTNSHEEQDGQMNCHIHVLIHGTGIRMNTL